MSMVPWSPPWTCFDQVGDDPYDDPYGDDEDDNDDNINKTMEWLGLPEDWPLGSAVLQYPQQSQSNC